jgi:BirA family biotin operon repressor/biotin-[acetyl-CoA-carboxylase] ligase
MSGASLGYRIFRYAELDSTNDQAKRLLTGAISENFIVVADKQNAGRGRSARPWQSPKGNLACSFVVSPDVSQARLSDLSFVTAVALQEAIADCLQSGPEPKIKWPNDILVSGAKISGILLEVESGSMAGRPDRPNVVVGVGVNVGCTPQGLDRATTSLKELGANQGAKEFMNNLSARFFAWYAVWQEKGFGPIRNAWLDHAVGLGEEIKIRSGNDEQTGVFEALNEQGALILRSGDGTAQTITAGDVFLM